MESLLLLIPVSFVLLALAGILYWWAVRHRQFDSLELHALDIFDDETPTERPKPCNS